MNKMIIHILWRLAATCFSILAIVVCSAFPQVKEMMILNEKGEQVELATGAQYVPNEVIVRFVDKSLYLPDGTFRSARKNLQGKHAVKTLLDSLGVREVRKVFRKFTEKDTIKTLESDKSSESPISPKFSSFLLVTQLMWRTWY